MNEKQSWCVRVHEHGGADKLVHEKCACPEPGPGEAQVQIIAAGVNYIDIYQREGLYPMDLPAIMGNEGAGVITLVGSRVKRVRTGDIVGFCTAGPGSYTQYRNIDAARLAILPPKTDPLDCAAVMLKGLTAEYLSRRCWPVRTDDTALVTAAAGGVGQLLCQMLVMLGAEVVGVVGSEHKAGRAADAGCSHVLCGYGNLDKRVREKYPDGVSAVFDSVGASTFEGVLGALAPRGCLVTYGNASGPPPAVAPLDLAKRGSLFITRPTLAHYFASSAELQSGVDALFGMISRGLRPPPLKTWPLKAAAQAQTALQSRELDGVAVLTVDG